MRRITLVGTFLVLLGGLYCLWQWRFERSTEYPTFRLADLRESATPSPAASWSGSGSEMSLRLKVDPAHRNGVIRMELPGVGAEDFLHLRFRVSGENLAPGQDYWEDGRCIVEWHPVSGNTEWENDPFSSVRFDWFDGLREVVMRPERGPAIPAIRVENLGVSGDVVITTLEATVVRERLVWKIGKWFLAGGWLLWAVACARPQGNHRVARSLAAASVWLVMCLYCVVPGPWKALRSFPQTFQMGTEVRMPVPVATGTPGRALPAEQKLESVGKIPDKGDFTLKVKVHAAKARPLLHIALLFGPAVLTALLVGNAAARGLAIVLALGVEAAQMSFGFGFDWLDVSDLLCDAAGISLALLVATRLRRWYAARRQVVERPRRKALRPSTVED